ncbi:MAG: cyclic-di-AMP receptor [Anaerolineae bacterium]
MKLIMSIVNSEDARPLIDTLMRSGYRATMISTTGGFLREGNATILVVTQDERVDEVLGIIRQNCHTRTQHVNPLPPVMEPGEMYLPTPIEVEVGGATVFVLNVERSERY